MKKDQFPESEILSVGQFLRSYTTGGKNGERFCFILGSGASVDSGIPMGSELEHRWMACLMGEEDDQDGTKAFEPGETRKLASHLKAEGKLQHDFSEIEKEWNRIRKAGTGSLSSKYYFDLYKIRFAPNHRNGYYYLEDIMADREPSFGYHTLAKLLTDEKGNNLVITTNFDNLMEDALFLFGNRKPLVINHELLADYIGNHNVKRPIIAKVHRGMFFDPLNDPQDTNGLKGKWHEVLRQAFHIYTPIVIGYGGGDHSLMDFLMDEKTYMPNGIYWCYVERFGLPDTEIQRLVKENNGWFVRTDGFDSLMLKMGMEMFPDEIGAHETEEYLRKKTNERISRYNDGIERLMEKDAKAEAKNKAQQEYKETIDSFKKREEEAQEVREKKQTLTAWDYARRGSEHYKKKEFEKSVDSYTTAIQMQGDVAMFYYNRSISYKDLREYDKALEDCKKALEIDPKYEKACYNMGSIYYSRKESEKAIEAFCEAIHINPQYSLAYLGRGVVYKNNKEYDKAMMDYDRSIELNPDYPEAYRFRGNLYDTLEDYEKAVKDFEKALELDPEIKPAKDGLQKVKEKLERSRDPKPAT